MTAVASRSVRSSRVVIRFTKWSLCPEVANSFVLAARLFVCLWVIKMAVRISAKNDAQDSSSFFHLKNSVFLSFSKSDAMLAEFWLRLRQDRGGGSLAGLGSFRREKWREECVWVLTVVEPILLQSCGWSRTRCLPENPFQASMVSFWLLSLSSKVTFVTRREFSMGHLCPC